MNIDKLTIADIKQLRSLLNLDQQRGPSQQTHSFVIGEKYLIRTVTMHYTGRVVVVTDSDVLLEDAAWIADTGRFADSLATGSLGEVEPYQDDVAVSRGCIIDFTKWTHDLPRKQK